MTLEDLGNLGDFVGGAAVIVTLVYLAVQIRQNTRMLRQATGQTFRSDSTAVIGLTAHSAENAAVYRKGLTHPDQLSPDERTHFFLLLTANFFHLAQGHLAYLEGAQSEVTWESQRLAVKF